MHFALDKQLRYSVSFTPVFHIKDNPYLTCFTAITFHKLQHTIQIQHWSCTPHTVSAYSQHRPYLPCSVYNYIQTATHNITHSPHTSTCTTFPPLPTPLPSTTLLCTQLTNTKHINFVQAAAKMAQDVDSHLVWLVFEGSIPTFSFSCSNGVEDPI